MALLKQRQSLRGLLKNHCRIELELEKDMHTLVN